MLCEVAHVLDATPLGWGGVGWDVNVHVKLHLYVMLRYATPLMGWDVAGC